MRQSYGLFAVRIWLKSQVQQSRDSFPSVTGPLERGNPTFKTEGRTLYNALSKEYLPSKTSWTTLSRSLAL